MENNAFVRRGAALFTAAWCNTLRGHGEGATRVDEAIQRKSVA